MRKIIILAAVLLSGSLSFAAISNASTASCTALGTTCGTSQNSSHYGWASAAQSAAYDNPVITVWNGTANKALDFRRTQPASGIYRYEYAPGGVHSGMCASDPGDHKVRLRTCNTGNWQRWRTGNAGPGGNQLVNVATGRAATPTGNGAQLTTGGSDTAHSYWTWISGTAPSPSPATTTASPAPSATATASPSPSPSGGVLNSRTLCVYKNSISALTSFSTALGRPVNCSEVFANSDACWTAGSTAPCDPYSSWTDPWYDHGTGDSDWSSWIRADAGRRIVLSHNLVPLDISQDMGDGKYNPGWRQDCADGAYSQYYPVLARNLVNAGFGHAVIRLGHEMNGDWYSGALGSDPGQYGAWAQCFAKIVQGMRSVTGASFLFDWNVNQGYRDIPFSSYYPGDAYVDVMGMDAYDSGMPGNPASQPDRWNAEYAEGGGLSDFIAFARSHGKPASLPEWGLAGTADGGIGDDPYYVRQIISLISASNVAYTSYFDTGSSGIPEIESQAGSWPVYKDAFGPGGNLQGAPW